MKVMIDRQPGQQMPGMGAMIGPMLEKIKGDLPLGMSLVTSEKRMDVFVPAATLKGLGALTPAAGAGPMPQM